MGLKQVFDKINIVDLIIEIMKPIFVDTVELRHRNSVIITTKDDWEYFNRFCSLTQSLYKHYCLDSYNSRVIARMDLSQPYQDFLKITSQMTIKEFEYHLYNLNDYEKWQFLNNFTIKINNPLNHAKINIVTNTDVPKDQVYYIETIEEFHNAICKSN